MSLPIVILAGGKATRLGHLAETVPKLLQPINDEPFAVHQIRQFQRWGLTDLVYCVNHLKQPILDFLGDGSNWGVKIRYCMDRGVSHSGAVVEALPLLPPWFFLTYGDTLLECGREDLEVMWGQILWHQAMLTVHEGGDYGLHLLTPEATVAWCRESGPLTVSGLRRHGLMVATYAIHRPFHEIGTPDSLAATAAWLQQQSV